MLLHYKMDNGQRTEKIQKKEKARADYQTVSIFLILAGLTAIFVVGLRWATMTPSSIKAPPTVESATK